MLFQVWKLIVCGTLLCPIWGVQPLFSAGQPFELLICNLQLLFLAPPFRDIGQGITCPEETQRCAACMHMQPRPHVLYAHGFQFSVHMHVLAILWLLKELGALVMLFNVRLASTDNIIYIYIFKCQNASNREFAFDMRFIERSQHLKASFQETSLTHTLCLQA
jgi:hypothetical protein